MPTKTISVRIEAYEKLRRAKRDASESFSDVIMRARWDTEPLTGGELLRIVRERGPVYTAEQLDEVDEAVRSDRPPEDKWNRA
ncbi:MAG: antitoxin VapB family protein [bacterium]